MHEVRLTVYGASKIHKLRDTSVRRSDHQISSGAVKLATTPGPNGVFTHYAGKRPVWEHPNGRLTTNGRAIKNNHPLAFAFNPLPAVLSVMRCKTPAWAELVKRPFVPLAAGDKPGSMPILPPKPPRRAGRPAEMRSIANVLRHWRQAVFIGGQKP